MTRFGWAGYCPELGLQQKLGHRGAAQMGSLSGPGTTLFCLTMASQTPPSLSHLQLRVQGPFAYILTCDELPCPAGTQNPLVPRLGQRT